jgi:hypothetical protein
VDRGLRLAEKRQLPLGRERRQKWLDTRDELYEEIQVCRSLDLLARDVDFTDGVMFVMRHGAGTRPRDTTGSRTMSATCSIRRC